MQNVFFSSPPMPSTCPRSGAESRNGSGAYPRERRIMYGLPPRKSITESSARVRISRSFERAMSQRPAICLFTSSSHLQIGTPETFPLVIIRLPVIGMLSG